MVILQYTIYVVMSYRLHIYCITGYKLRLRYATMWTFSNIKISFFLEFKIFRVFILNINSKLELILKQQKVN